jgi:hypothetical protein
LRLDSPYNTSALALVKMMPIGTQQGGRRREEDTLD